MTHHLMVKFKIVANYITSLLKVVLVKKKSNNKWSLWVHHSDLKKACPKDAYPLPNIDKMIDNSSGFKLPLFLDEYSKYNQILMDCFT